MARKRTDDGRVRVIFKLMSKKPDVNIRVSIGVTCAYDGNIMPMKWDVTTNNLGEAEFLLPPNRELTKLGGDLKDKSMPYYKVESSEFSTFVFEVPKNVDVYVVGREDRQ